MDSFATELSAEAMALVGVIAVIIQQVKGIKPIENLKTRVPNIYNILSMGLGVGAAYMLAIPNWPIAGIIMGLMASGAYSTTKKENKT